MMKRIAAIDIGTNSVKMTVTDAGDDGLLSVVQEASEITRLGAGVDAARRLSEDGMARTLAVVVRFAEQARAGGAVQIAAAGTSALRDAANGSDFVARVQQEAGLSVEIISGEREALLAFSAVQTDPDLGLPPDFGVVTFDIGGGSTELTLGGAGSLERRISLDMGAVRLTERFLHSDPPAAAEMAQAAAFIADALQAFPPPEQQPILVGLGGTVAAVAASVLALQDGPADALAEVHGVLLFDGEAQAALTRFSAAPLAERRAIAGLEPARADVIIGGALILVGVLAHFHSDRFLVSTRGLRFGLLAEIAHQV